MKEYYDTRAPEYDEWYLGIGRFAAFERDGSSHFYGHLEEADRARFLDGQGLAAELGGGDVLHDGDWFVMVRSVAPSGDRPASV